MTPNNSIHTVAVGTGDEQVKIHAISTGKVAVRPSFKEKKGPGFIAKLNMFLDKQFTEFLPVYVFVIEHPEGIFLVDTGENAAVLQPNYFAEAKGLQKVFNEKHLKFEIQAAEEIGPQLKTIGIEPDQVSKVILTHLHIDHTDGLHYFPNTEILLPRLESEKPYGHTPFLYPQWFQPSLFDWQKDSDLPFQEYYPLTQDGRLFAVPTPGHTFGHCSVVLRVGEYCFFFAGDTSYEQRHLLNETLAGGHASFRQAKETLRRIKRFAAHEKLIYLPSHDPQGAQRLLELSTAK